MKTEDTLAPLSRSWLDDPAAHEDVLLPPEVALQMAAALRAGWERDNVWWRRLARNLNPRRWLTRYRIWQFRRQLARLEQ